MTDPVNLFFEQAANGESEPALIGVMDRLTVTVSSADTPDMTVKLQGRLSAGDAWVDLHDPITVNSADSEVFVLDAYVKQFRAVVEDYSSGSVTVKAVWR